MHKPRRKIPPCWLPLLVLVAAGCGIGNSDPAPEQPPPQPFEGMEVGVAVPAGAEFPTAWDGILIEWAAQTGAEPWIEEYNPGEEDQPAASGAALFVLPMTQLAELAAEDRLAPIPADQLSAENLDWLDLFHGLRENVASLERQAMVVPISSPVLVCYYRRDLLDRAGLSPPATWDDYQRLLETLDRWAPGMTAVEPWGEDYRATMFFARALAYAKHPGHFSLFFDIDSGEPLIDSPGFVRGLEMAQTAWASMPTEVAQYTPADCRREFFAGNAALAMALEVGPGEEHSELPFGPSPPGVSDRTEAAHAGAAPGSIAERPEAMRVGLTRLPGASQVYNHSTGAWEGLRDGRINQVTLTAFAGLCAGVSAESTPAQAQAAWNLLATVAIDFTASAFPGVTKSLCRNSQLGDPSPWVGRDLAADEAHQYLGAVSESLRDTRLVAELPVIGRQEFRAALTEELGTVVSAETDPKTALEAAARRWREITGQVGAEKVVNSYRRSVGLSPRRGDSPESRSASEGTTEN